jgi:hypothetical protein
VTPRVGDPAHRSQGIEALTEAVEGIRHQVSVGVVGELEGEVQIGAVVAVRSALSAT